MQRNHLVSIIVSCYNAEKYITEALESLLGQSYMNLEIIVVDDGSTDGSAILIKKIGDKRLKYVYQTNKGQDAALNKGFEVSSGELIKFYDSDDILHPEAIAGQVESLRLAGERDISFIEWRRFYNNVVPDKIDGNNQTIHRDCTPVEYITWTGTPPMYQCGMWLIPRSLITEAGLWNEGLTMGNDTEFFVRLLTRTDKLRFSNKGYTLYRTNVGATTVSGDFSEKNIRSALKSFDMTTKLYLSIENSDRMKKVIIESYLMLLDWAYPKHKYYSAIIERRLKSFSGKKIDLNRPGKPYNLIKLFFGWRVAKIIYFWYYKIVYKR